MLSVEPILERTFLRSGLEALLGGRGALLVLPVLPVLTLLPTLAVVFLASADTVEAVAALGAELLGLGRLEGAPGALGELEVAVEGVVVLLLVALPGALLGRPRSAVGSEEKGENRGQGLFCFSQTSWELKDQLIPLLMW